MLKTFNYTFKLFLCFPLLISAQETKKDSLKESFIPTGIRLGWEAIRTVRSFTDNSFTGWEGTVDIDFRNYYLAAEVGSWSKNVLLSNGTYDNSGNYWRVGIDINMLKKDPVKNMLFLGFRFGHSNYQEQLIYSDTTDYGIFSKSLSNPKMKANWGEITTGLKVKVLKGFWMGYTARIKFLASFGKDQSLQSYDIPGYGLTYKKPWWGFDYYLMYRIPIRKEK